MGFTESVKTCLMQKYAGFSGRASRSEYWFFALFYFLVSIVLSVLGQIALEMVFNIIGLVFGLAVLVPSLAVSVRRLHDLDRSGWWLLISFVPLIGALVLLYWFVQKGSDGSNNFGDDPLDGESQVGAAQETA